MTQTEKAQTSLTDEIQLGLHKDIPLDDYHNRLPGLSSTQLKELITGNRYLGWLLFVAIVFVLWWVLVGLAILVALWREKHFPES